MRRASLLRALVPLLFLASSAFSQEKPKERMAEDHLFPLFMIPGPPEPGSLIESLIGSVEGRVRDAATGAPLQGVEVWVDRDGVMGGPTDPFMRASQVGRYRRVLTAEMGQFFLPRLQPGEKISVEIYREGYIPERRAVDLTEATPRAYLDVKLRAGGAIEGRAVDASGRLLTDGLVRVQIEDGRPITAPYPDRPRRSFRLVVIDEQGNFQMAGLPDGLFRVDVMDGLRDQMRYVGFASGVRVRAGEVSRVELQHAEGAGTIVVKKPFLNTGNDNRLRLFVTRRADLMASCGGPFPPGVPAVERMNDAALFATSLDGASELRFSNLPFGLYHIYMIVPVPLNRTTRRDAIFLAGAEAAVEIGGTTEIALSHPNWTEIGAADPKILGALNSVLRFHADEQTVAEVCAVLTRTFSNVGVGFAAMESVAGKRVTIARVDAPAWTILLGVCMDLGLDLEFQGSNVVLVPSR